MARVTIRDRMIWSNHIEGDAALVARLESLRPGQTVELIVDDKVEGVWERCAGEGKPAAVRPVDTASKAAWKWQFENRRGQPVEVRLSRPPPEHWQDATQAERDAAWEAFKALTRAGWRSESTDRLSRDDLHER